MTLRAVVYARFSSEKQRDRSIEDQVALCRDFCQRDGLSVVEVYEDRAISGASTAYRPLPGQAGRLEILPDEASIVRRIFESYLDGKSPRDIAGALNRDGIRAPRGGHWNASTIGGSRSRTNRPHPR